MRKLAAMAIGTDPFHPKGTAFFRSVVLGGEINFQLVEFMGSMSKPALMKIRAFACFWKIFAHFSFVFDPGEFLSQRNHNFLIISWLIQCCKVIYLFFKFRSHVIFITSIWNNSNVAQRILFQLQLTTQLPFSTNRRSYKGIRLII